MTGDPIFGSKEWEDYKNFLVSKEAKGGKVTPGSLSHFNNLGYYGIYQFGVQALESIGRLKPGTYKKTKGKNAKSQREILENPNNWVDGYDLASFSTKEAQDAALLDYTKRNYRSLRIPLQENGVTNPTDVFSYLASAHLGGAGTVRKYIKEGTTGFKDANNISPITYRDDYLKYKQGDQVMQPDPNTIKAAFNKRITGQIDFVNAYSDLKDQGETLFIPTPEDVLNTIDMGEEPPLHPDDLFIIKKKLGNIINEDKLRSAADSTKDQYDKMAVKMYKKSMENGLQANGINPNLDFDLAGYSRLSKGEDNTQGEFAYGGPLQPNGNRTKFTRDEDILAQQNTMAYAEGGALNQQQEPIRNTEKDSDFDPEGDGYDYVTAKQYGLGPDETGHWPSRVPETGQLLKGRGHKTFEKTIKAEEEIGYKIFKGKDGKYYSQPAYGISEYSPYKKINDKIYNKK